MDETLITRDKTITERARQKILEMLSEGNYFVLSSGRSTNSILNVLETLGIQQNSPGGGIYASAYNGAVLYDCGSGETIAHYDVPVPTAQAIFDKAAGMGIHIQTYTDTHIISSADDREIAFYTNAIKSPYIVSMNLEKELSHAPSKLLAIDLDDRAKLEALRREVEESEIGADITCAFSNAQYLEFYNKKAGKGNALVNLCRALCIHVKNSVAAGDEENDISMLEAAGVGACMVNGNPAVKAHADYVTQQDNNHDGIVEIIDKFILNQ